MDPDGGGEKECGEKPNGRAARIDAGKRAAAVTPESQREGAAGSPCGACKFLRRKCLPGCVFASHFASEQGPARFAAVHKVFGASNVSKLLSSVPAGRQHDAVVTIYYEAQARLADPVYGCVSTVLALQQQVLSLSLSLSLSLGERSSFERSGAAAALAAVAGGGRGRKPRFCCLPQRAF
ncbi:lob domain-containing protein [Musa troglodytarum]|uniref:Lob domain-containing protein n=1 Tax=Musa troglodytarum TaxID=320322 RepID=A0A9E7HGM0_9LILI|nr:lob domain-containing protein [Musa troglodytarum]